MARHCKLVFLALLPVLVAAAVLAGVVWPGHQRDAAIRAKVARIQPGMTEAEVESVMDRELPPDRLVGMHVSRDQSGFITGPSLFDRIRWRLGW
jgi:hypothetical protein